MFGLFRLSETAKAVIWLWQNDHANWAISNYAVVHRPTGVGVWIANSVYGLHLDYNIPEQDRAGAHACNGRELRLKWRDRRMLWRVIGEGRSRFAHQLVQRQISDWAADNIQNRSAVSVSQRR